MLIGQIEKVYQALHHNGNVCFEYKDEAYMIEAGRDTDKKRYLAIWAD